ncbi:thiolase-like protein [Xylariaceae sp. FL1651]|nr:thiolase-like protein [Xylariaceae sp. FL1651]
MSKESFYGQGPMVIVVFGYDCLEVIYYLRSSGIFSKGRHSIQSGREVAVQPRKPLSPSPRRCASRKARSWRIALSPVSVPGFSRRVGTRRRRMEPNQYRLLEVGFKSLESAGMMLHDADMQTRDRENCPVNNAVGVARALFANRLSHFLTSRGPVLWLIQHVPEAFRDLIYPTTTSNLRQVNAAIVTASNLYIGPEHLINIGRFSNTRSPTTLCHVFDIAADGYVKAEAVSLIMLKRLEDAIRDRNPIHTVVLGTASTSNGKTLGITSPSSASRALAIRSAYAKARIRDLNSTVYLEARATGQQHKLMILQKSGRWFGVCGNAFGRQMIAHRFSMSHPSTDQGIKSNIGHSGLPAGNSGLIKAILVLENGFIPKTSTFVNPSPKIDFASHSFMYS